MLSKSSKTFIKVECLTASYPSPGGRVQALRGIDLEVPEGELLVLLGSSGSGKTTLLNAIAGLQVVDSGKVFLRGEDCSSMPVRERRVSMVLQNLGLYPRKSVAENIEYPMKIAGLPKAERQQKSRVLMDLLRISDLRDRLPRQLSGGQRQRVAIARALARETDLLLLDEPFSDLDAEVRFALRNELKLLHRSRGLTTLLVTHDQADAMALGDRIALIQAGRVLEIDTPSQLYREPSSVFAAHFIGRPPINLFRGKWQDGKWMCSEPPGFLPLELPPNFEAPKDQELILGLRPESIQTRVGDDWVVRLVESAGPDVILHLEAGSLQVTCRVNDEMGVAEGTKVGLRAGGGVLLFYGADGVRVRP